MQYMFKLFILLISLAIFSCGESSNELEVYDKVDPPSLSEEQLESIIKEASQELRRDLKEIKADLKKSNQDIKSSISKLKNNLSNLEYRKIEGEVILDLKTTPLATGFLHSTSSSFPPTLPI